MYRYEKKRVDGDFWQKDLGLYPEPRNLQCVLEEMDTSLVEIQTLFENEGEIGPGYSSLNYAFEAFVVGYGCLNVYARDLAYMSTVLLDDTLYEGFNKGATESISRIHAEDFTTENTLGIMEKDFNCTRQNPYPEDKELASLTIADFMGIDSWKKSNLPEEFTAFSEIYKNSYENLKDDINDMSYEKYLEAVLKMGEFNHTMDQPLLQFASNLADILIVPALIKASTGYDLITGEDLTDFERGMALVGAVIDIFTFGQGVAAEKAAGAGIKKLAVFIGKNMVVDMASCSASYLIGESCKELNLPVALTLVLSIGGGMITSKGLTDIIFTSGAIDLSEVDPESIEQVLSLKKASDEVEDSLDSWLSGMSDFDKQRYLERYAKAEFEDTVLSNLTEAEKLQWANREFMDLHGIDEASIDPNFIVLLDENNLTYAEFQTLKNTDLADLTQYDIDRMYAVREAMNQGITSDTWFNKTIPINDVDDYVNKGYTASGFIAEDARVNELVGYEAKRSGLRLDYTMADGTKPYPAGGDSYGYIKFQAENPDAMRIPYAKEYGGVDEFDQPFTGNGFLKNNYQQAIPEFYAERGALQMAEGAEMHIVMGHEDIVYKIWDGTAWVNP